jgi:hypothetical protein
MGSDTPKVLILGQGTYNVAKVDAERSELVSTGESVDPASLVPFGLQYKQSLHINDREGEYAALKKQELSEGEWQVEGLTRLLSELPVRARHYGADYLLVRILKNTDLGTYWNVEAETQLFLEK